MHIFAEDIPPELEKRLQVIGARRRLNLASQSVEVLEPRFRNTDEVNNPDVVTESAKKLYADYITFFVTEDDK